MEAVSYVDIEEFMGTWYVIASIPTFLEKGALNPIERYSLNDDGTVATEFSYSTQVLEDNRKASRRKGSFRRTRETPFGDAVRLANKADYRIVFFILRQQSRSNWSKQKRFLWIMSETSKSRRFNSKISSNSLPDLGYDRTKIEISNWQRALREVK